MRNQLLRFFKSPLVLDTPTCLGSGDADSPTDLALLRDSVSDCALLTGASIAGALRNYLREYQGGYGVEEQKGDRATTLFGGTRRDPDGEKRLCRCRFCFQQSIG